MNLSYTNVPPSLDEYMRMRDMVHFVKISERIANNALKNAFYLLCVRDGEKVVGMTRILSEGGYANFITDVIVIPEYQEKGIGSELMKRTMDYLKSTLEPDEKIVVYLMSASNKEPFYRKFGFLDRPNELLGAGMSQWIKYNQND